MAFTKALPSVLAKTAAYTVSVNDGDNVHVNVDASAGAVTITLYAASGNSGKIVTVKKTDSSTNAVTVDANASETIDGSATLALSSQYLSVALVCDGTNWHKVSVSTPPTSVVALADGATPALDASLGSIFELTAAGDRTIAVPTNPTSGQKIVIRHKASGADRTLALNTGAGGFRFGTDVTALTATTSAKTDYIGCIYNAADSRWDVVAYAKGY